MLVASSMLVACQTPNPVLRKHGMEAYRVGDIEYADERFSTAVEQDPTDWKSQWYLGRVRLSQNRDAQAESRLLQAYALRSEHAETPQIIDDLAEALVRQGKNDQLADLLGQSATRYATVHDYLRQGKYLARAGDIDSAKVAYLKAIRFAKADDAEPYIEYANFLEDVGDSEGALYRLRQAYGIDPENIRLANRFRRYGIVPGPTISLPRDPKETGDSVADGADESSAG
jgi:Flp pilus assembly protein TadD